MKTNFTNKRNSKLLIVAMASTIVVAGLSACTNNNNADSSGTPSPSSPSAAVSASPSASSSATTAPTSGSEDGAILDAFKGKISEKASYADLNAQLDADLPKVSKDTADEMLRQLLAYYETNLSEMQSSFEEEKLQQQLQKVQWPFTEDQLSTIEDGAAREKVQAALDGGFKLETAEGFAFPVVDYGKLKRFDSYASPAMKDYVALLALESDQKRAADGGLTISWEELANRTLTAERFVKDYPDSPEKAKATERYLLYLTNLLYGLDNTPIFDFDTYKVKPDITELYEKIVSENPDTATAKLAQEFLDVLAKTDGYVFRKGDSGGQSSIPEVQAFRDQLEEKAKSLLG
ncbi:hypothetical protein [Cohnella thailandensis]|uniref:Uncharacterized protein n=1 Tax=Cohnella thailandensis TaxID=557557 RepID=A0A841SVG3_9BACL|nr:hypothetical protein [Cohnella thailandensis]MBB6633607.1 hypothetical protein [Cohnella thailandensis]MBP1976391.1 hypothetical protein [Cohnella thailandensis]